MRVFAIRIEHPFDVSVQRPQYPDPRMHQKVAALSGTNQALDGGLPFVELLIGFRKLGDVIASILKSDELATAR
jgi:hypothetical protein